MLKKIFPLLFIVIFIAIFSYFNGEDFFKHQEKKQEIQEQKIVTQGKLEDFSLEKIRELDGTEFFYTPYKPLLDTIVKKINNAEKRVYIEVYMLTERRIKESLVKAHKRGIDVKVVLEHSPYLAVMLNQKHFKELKEKGINIVWSNAQNYALNHSKIMLIDDELVLSSGNFTYSTFAHNRDLFIITRDKKIVNIFTEIFNKDFNGEEFQIYDNNIILSPYSSRAKFRTMFEGAEKSIQMYAQYLKDEKLFKLLQKKAKQGVQVEIVLSKNGYKQYLEENVGNEYFHSKQMGNNKIDSKKVEYADLHTLQISAINNKAKMHSKAILIDNKYLFIGSINFSTSSIDSNREMGLLLTNSKIIEKFLEIFNKDM